ncbi:DUF1302 domain-containing protein [Immundisolibacter sp.]
MKIHTPKCRLSIMASAGVLAGSMGVAHAFDFNIGSLDASFDTDIGWGLSQRTAKPNRFNLGPYGNRYLFQDRWDIFSNVIKGSHTFEVKGDSYGGLLRGNWFYDFEMANQKLPDAAENRAKQHGDITDAYVYKRFFDDQSLSIRLGKQVISWGENTFIGGAINDINTVDISKLRTPGAELKDALSGTPAIDISYNFLENYTVEAFALFAYDEIKVDPMGNFFAGLDAIADGGGFPNAVVGGRPRCLAPDGVACDLLGGFLTRTGDNLGGGGQWGVALRKFLPNFANGGEVAIYYQNLHDHLPMISGAVGTGKFQVDYPENIERWGASFNTNMAGLALGGEFSYRRNAPLQMTLPLLLSGPAVGPFNAYIGPYLAGGGHLGDGVKGFERIERYQTQLTVQKNWGVLHWAKADAASTIGEIAWGWIGGLPSLKPVGGPLGTAANPMGGTLTRYNIFEPDVSKDFGKLVIRHSMTYQAALFNLVALEPNVAFAWDFHGYSNELGGAKLVVEGRKALTVGLNFSYGSDRWKGGVAYTNFWGDATKVNAAGSRLNGTNDRDFLSFNASYSF